MCLARCRLRLSSTGELRCASLLCSPCEVVVNGSVVNGLGPDDARLGRGQGAVRPSREGQPSPRGHKGRRTANCGGRHLPGFRNSRCPMERKFCLFFWRGETLGLPAPGNVSLVRHRLRFARTCELGRVRPRFASTWECVWRDETQACQDLRMRLAG